MDEFINKKFGELTILERVNPKKKKAVYYNCQCSCGKQKVFRRDVLRNGMAKSCGCKTQEFKAQTLAAKGGPTEAQIAAYAEGKKRLQDSAKRIQEDTLKELVGKSFNSLTVIGPDPNGDPAKVLCNCKCHSNKIVRRSDLRTGKVTSCGCERTERIRKNKKGYNEFQSWIGRKFGMLTVIEDLPHFMSNCKCDCGEISKNVFKGNLQAGTSRSCGCKSDEWRIETNMKLYGSPTRGVSSSKAEKEISDWINSLGLETEKRLIDLSKKTSLHDVDIYVTDKRIGIEYNGIKWHHEDFIEIHRKKVKDSRKDLGKHYHKEKSDLGKANDMRIIHIWDFEWINKKEQVKSYLKSALGVNSRKIGARTTEVKIVDKTEARSFLNKYHIQGSCRGTPVGLFLGEELLAVGVFGPHHRDSTRTVMSRWCVKEDVTIAGGLTKLMKNFSKVSGIKTDRVYTWADYRLSDGKGYESSGWVFEKQSGPDYFYYDLSKKIAISKQARKKTNVGTPEGMTEAEHAKLDGLVRVYDCGKLTYYYETIDKSPEKR